MAIIATLIGCQGIDEFKAMVPAGLNFGVTPVEVKEIVYQAVAYLGIGRVFPFLHGVNDVLTARCIKLPLEGKSNTTIENRLEKEIQAQVDIFGDGMKEFYKSVNDIGILASLDPVALDQACVDLVYAAHDGKTLIERMECRHGIHTVEHAEEIGLGTRNYDLYTI